MSPRSFIIDFFTKGHSRTLKVKKNATISFIIKGLSIVIGLLMVPMTIDYINPTKYGIWITLSSLIAWFSFFDIGFGNGLRNRFAEALANQNYKLARAYVSTTYAILIMIVFVLLTIFYIFNPFINWNSIVNISKNDVLLSELRLLVQIIFTFFSFNFILKLINTILIADQRPAMSSLFDFLGKSISFGLIFLLTKTTEGSLIYLGVVTGGAHFLVLTLASIWFFKGRYKEYRPSIKFIDFSKAKDLLSLGIKFFIIQIAVILLYQTNNIIIAQLFGPSEVTTYTIAFKYFSILTMGFSIVLTPFWSAFTEAWIKREKEWIKKSMKKLMSLWGLLVISGIVMLLASEWIYKAWVGDSIAVPFGLSILVLVWVLLNAWNNIFSHFLNGVGKIKLQLYLGITAAIINVPLAIFLGNSIGINGVILANVIVVIPGVFIYLLQYRRLIKGNSIGIWNE